LKKLVIIGAGGTGEDVSGFISDINAAGPTYECLGFLDDDPSKQGTTVRGRPVLGPLSAASDFSEASFVNCLGSPRSFLQRARQVEEIGIDPAEFETIIHPSAVVSVHADIHGGCVLYPFVHVGPGVALAAHVTVLSHTAIHHHSRIGELTIIAGGCNVSGNVRIGASCYLGTGCSIRDGVAVGAGSLVGMGSVVIADVAEGSVVAGVPARQLRAAD